jgi:hypothetical protein
MMSEIDGFNIIAGLKQSLSDCIFSRVHGIYRLRVGRQDMTDDQKRELDSFNGCVCFRKSGAIAMMICSASGTDMSEDR